MGFVEQPDPPGSFPGNIGEENNAVGVVHRNAVAVVGPAAGTDTLAAQPGRRAGVLVEDGDRHGVKSLSLYYFLF